MSRRQSHRWRTALGCFVWFGIVACALTLAGCSSGSNSAAVHGPNPNAAANNIAWCSAIDALDVAASSNIDVGLSSLVLPLAPDDFKADVRVVINGIHNHAQGQPMADDVRKAVGDIDAHKHDYC